jgi:hypothetical protein
MTAAIQAGRHVFVLPASRWRAACELALYPRKPGLTDVEYQGSNEPSTFCTLAMRLNNRHLTVVTFLTNVKLLSSRSRVALS